MASGIYQIRNALNGKCYIGSAVNFKRRWAVHLSTLRRGKHSNSHLQRAFDKYGELVFSFIILELVDDLAQLILREQYFLDTAKPEYNISLTAGSCLGVRHTKETRRKLSGKRNHNYGKHFSDETRARMRAARLGKRGFMSGRHHNTVSKQKMREAKIGKRSSFYGKHHSEEAKQKIGRAAMGRQSPMYGKHHSAETKQKISRAQIGKKHSAETKQKMSEARGGEQNPMYGRQHSAEAKRKISASLLAYWHQKRRSNLMEEQEIL